MVQITQLLIPYYYQGDVLVGGSAEFFRAETTTPYTVFVDSNGNGGATTRPFESDGTLVAFTDGTSDLKIVIKDSDGAVIQTFDNLYYDRGSSSVTVNGKVAIDGSSTMTGNLDLGNNSITNGGNITLGTNKALVVLHGGTPIVAPQDGLVISETAGYVSIRGGENLTVYDNGSLAMTVDSAMTTLPTGLTVGGVNILSTISTINQTIAGASYVSKTGDTMSGALTMGNQNIQTVNALDAKQLTIKNIGGVAQWYIDDNLQFQIKNSASALVFTVNSLGAIKSGSGTASLPSYSFITDTDTGMSSSVSNTLDFSTGGTKRLSISATGAVELATSLKLPTGATINEISIDGTMAGNSDSCCPTEKATKTYADTKLTGTLSTDGTLADNSDTKVCSQKAVKTYADTKLTGTLSTDGTLADNSDTKVCSQKATKTYADTKIAGTLSTDGTLADNSDTNVSSQKAVKTYIANILGGGRHGSYTTSTVGNGSSNPITITHSLGEKIVNVVIMRNSDNKMVIADVTFTDTNSISILFGTTPTTNQYSVKCFN